jgi:hypothetical protein
MVNKDYDWALKFMFLLDNKNRISRKYLYGNLLVIYGFLLFSYVKNPKIEDTVKWYIVHVGRFWVTEGFI